MITAFAVYAVIVWVVYGAWFVNLYIERQRQQQHLGMFPQPDFQWIVEQFCFWITAPLWLWFVVILLLLG